MLNLTSNMVLCFCIGTYNVLKKKLELTINIHDLSCFIRDNRYKRDLLPKLTSQDESNEVTIQEVPNVRGISSLNKFKQSYTRRKERALRIHLTGTE